MVRGFQVTFDAADPERLADFWASALGYQSQPPPEGYSSWSEFLQSIGVPEDKHHQVAAIVDPDGVRPRVFFQKVPEGKTAKNRVHLDVRVSAGASGEEAREQVAAEVERLETMGAVKQHEKDDFGEHWVVMTDPEGNEFCVS